MEQAPSSYLVLARRYRPQVFEDLVGQEGLVRVLSHALRENRFPHALVLTGTRGVGKTTTARLVAKALNCLTPKENRSHLMSACGTCASCVSLTQDRDLDVLEMDAASHTGVDDVRELIEAARYKPLVARYKVYIIDEVHMLSKSAFNALLKTLEEPPAHLKFIFATTEIHKVPDTILSRCMRFDLRRIDEKTLDAYFHAILEKEGVSADDGAIALIARAADGSARDGLSLLDQALNISPEKLTLKDVRQMLSLADRTQMLALLDALVTGNILEALQLFKDLYTQGCAPQDVLSELLAITHWISLLKAAPTLAPDGAYGQAEQEKGLSFAQSLSMPVLARFWQILLKGYQEVKTAPQDAHACEMVLIRLAHVAALPTPGDVLDSLTSDPLVAPQGPSLSAAATTPTPAGQMTTSPEILSSSATLTPAAETSDPIYDSVPETFQELVDFVMERDIALGEHLRCDTHVIEYAPNALVFSPSPQAPRLLASQLRTRLEGWTGKRWRIELQDEGGEKTLSQQQQDTRTQRLQVVHQDPLIKAALDTFPLARIESLDGKPLSMQKGA